MNWKTVFDISTENPAAGWILPLTLPVLFFGATFLVVAMRRAKDGAEGKFPMVATVIGAFVFASIPAAIIGFCYKAHLEAMDYLKDNLAQNKCKQVEGTVANFDPMPASGHKSESFEVNGTRFAYSDFDQSNPGFHNATSHGGPIHEGLHVRIYYMPPLAHHEDDGNWIARLDVAE